MFRFEQPDHLYAAIILPILVVLFIIAMMARKRALARFGENSLIAQLMPKMSKYKHQVKFIFMILALAFLVVGWANPQWGSRKKKVKRKSVDVFIALDISRSMMARDIPPNRMERAKKFAQNLVDELRGDRVGIIIFAGNAYLQTPLTTDYAAAQLFLKTANPDMAPSQGTAISDAIDLAENVFGEENKAHKALVVITDGENHDEETIKRAKEANENGLMIFSVGVGTTEGDFIPVNNNGRQDYLRESQTGEPVRTQLNEVMLTDLANAGNGSYFNIRQESDVISSLRERINKLEKRELETRAFDEYESYFQYFLAAALLFLIIEFMISYRKNRFLEGKDLFE
jgi:Ca-activated chloride channel family protein